MVSQTTNSPGKDYFLSAGPLKPDHLFTYLPPFQELPIPLDMAKLDMRVHNALKSLFRHINRQFSWKRGYVQHINVVSLLYQAAG